MSSFLVQLFVALLKAFVPSIKEGLKDTNTTAVEESDGLEKRLRASVAETWGPMVALMCLSLILVGCGTRTVYVPDGTPVKIRESIVVKVWVKTKEGDIIATEIKAREGWFILPDKKK